MLMLALGGSMDAYSSTESKSEMAMAPHEEPLQTPADRYTGEPRPMRDPAQLRAQIATLKDRRQLLLFRYTAAHPAVLQVDRQIRILQERLAEIEAAPAAIGPPAP